MSQLEHTPGPWRQNGPYIFGPADNDGTHRCDVANVLGYMSSEGEANARLIVTAPQLLDTLKLVLRQYEQVCEDNHVMGWPDMVRSAHDLIAKATGEQEGNVCG